MIGGGQAGLAMGYQLAQRGRRFEIVDAAPEIGHVWRSRWDSLRLFTSGRYDNLPGLPFPAAADAYPGKDDVADYLQAYAAQFGLPVRLNTTVTSLTRADAAATWSRPAPTTIEARQVVLATGPFQVPFIPPVSAQLAADVHQLHSTDYRRPDDLPPGRVLVVGASNSGARSRSSSPQPARSNSPSGNDADRFRSGRWAGTSGRGRRHCAWTGSPPIPGWDDACPGGTRSSGPAPGSSPGVTASGSGPGSTGAAGRAVTFADGSSAGTTPWSGRPASPPTTPGSTSPTSTDDGGRLRQPRGRHPVPGAVHARPSSGSTPAARRCWAGSETTPRSSPSRSRPGPGRG